MTREKVALVTGASSGFGQLIATRLVQARYRVFGTSRRQQVQVPPGIEMLVLDVQSDSSVQACVERLLTCVDHVDLLVNNAGQAHASVIEETSLEDAKTLFETNFWGVVRVTRAVLPIMRQQGYGHIINVSSLAGLIGIPGQGFYSASKFALEGYSEALSLEVEKFNIKVTVVEPGFFKTNLHQSMAPHSHWIADYDGLRASVESALMQAVSQGSDPQPVASAIIAIAASRLPHQRYRIGSDALWVPRLKAMLPEKLFRLGLRKRFHLP